MNMRSVLATGAATAFLAFGAATSAAAATTVYDLTDAPPVIVAPPGVLTFGDLTVYGVVYDFGPNGNGGVGDASDFDLAPTYQDLNGIGVCNGTEGATQCKTNDTNNTGGQGSVDRNEALVLQFDDVVTLTSVGLMNFEPNSRFTFWRIESDDSLTNLFEYDGLFGPASPYTPAGFGSYTGQAFALTVKGSNHNGYQLASVSVLAVPEPDAWALMIMGFGGVGALVRRRRSAHA